jgi:hypothetical protein
MIMSNQDIVNEIRKGYVQEIASGKPPVTIGGTPGGLPPATPGEKPTSAREAGRMAARFFNTQ